MSPLTVDPGGFGRLAVALAVCLTVPGSAVLTLLRHPSRGIGRLALSIGVSVTVVPLAVLWASFVGVGWSRTGLAATMAACLAVTLAWGTRLWQRRRTEAGAERTVSAVALLLVLAMAVALRASQAMDLVATPWVDGYHHTLVAQLFVDRGGVPDSYRPYLAVDGFYYHFGFHALSAVVATLSGVPARLAVLWLGQALNAGAGLATWFLARRLGVSPSAAVWAAAVPTGLFFFPAYFLSWGRETQLAGLVALPAALMLLFDAIRPEPADLTRAESIMATVDAPRRHPAPARVVLAAVAAAGLLLVHYRVMVFYGLGAAVMVGWLLWCGRDPLGRRDVRFALIRLGAASLLALALGGPWLLRHLLPGIRHLNGASSRWYAGSSSAERLQDWAWQLTEHQNAVWLSVAVAGLIFGLLRRRPAAWATFAWLGLACLAVNPTWLGVPRTWMLPPSALVISLFVPAAVGVALFVEGAIAAALRLPGAARAVPWVVGLGAIGATWQGGVHQSGVVNDGTVFLLPADIEAMAWIRTHTPPEARFLVGTQHWQYRTFSGVDGGYWLPLLTGRQTTIPAALYTYGDPATVRAIGDLGQDVALGDALTSEQLLGVLDRAGTDFVYVGAKYARSAGADRKGFSKACLLEEPFLVQVYDRGGVSIFKRTLSKPSAVAAGKDDALATATQRVGVKRPIH